MMQIDGETLTPVEKVLCLQNVDIFKHATTEMLAYIGSIAGEVSVPGGEAIFTEGDASNGMFIVVSGSVRLERNGQEVLTAIESESFGTWALVDDEPRLMTATALQDTHVLRIIREEFFELLSDHDEITLVILKAVVARVKENAIPAIDRDLEDVQKHMLRLFA